MASANAKEQMIKAQQLIKAQRYDEARRILININHPKATEWLAKLDRVAPQLDDLNDPFESKEGNFFVNLGFALLPFLIAGPITALMVWILKNSGDGFLMLVRYDQLDLLAFALGAVIFVGTWAIVFILLRRYRRR